MKHVTVRTINRKHINQLPVNHDPGLNISDKQMLGSNGMGEIILLDNGGHFIRWSVTAYAQKLLAEIKPEDWKTEAPKAIRIANSVPSLFTDDGDNSAEFAALNAVAEIAAKLFKKEWPNKELKDALTHLANVRAGKV